MPQIVRWFRVTQDVNQDPEMWELREQFGDRAGFIWLEMLSIADRNKGIVGPASDQTRNQLASKCRSSRTKVGLILDWCRVKGWLSSDTHWRVAKWLKYNGSRKLIADSPILDSPSPPYPKIKNEASPVDNSKNGHEEQPWKPVADRIFKSDPQRFLKLIVWIKDSLKEQYSPLAVATALMDFESQDKKQPIDKWWPYLDKVRTKAHAKMMQGESEQYKAADLTHVGAVLRRIASVQ